MEWGLANLTMFDHGPQAAASTLEPILERAEELGDAPYVALAAASLAWAAYMLGDVATAVRLEHQGDARLPTAIRDLAGSTIGLPIGAVIALEGGRAVRRRDDHGGVPGASERYGVRPPIALCRS